VVEVIGFEPTAPSLRTKCSAELSYTPRCCSAGVYPRAPSRPNASRFGRGGEGSYDAADAPVEGISGRLTVHPAPRPARPFDRGAGATVACDGTPRR
jgi:hypothetical protein